MIPTHFLKRKETVMKLKDLRKKVRRLERRLQEGPKKLAKLRRKLETMEKAKAARRQKAAAQARAASRQIHAPEKPVKKKLNLSPERREQLAAAMRARWAAKRAGAGAILVAAENVTLEPATVPQEGQGGA
jgi:predicted  nucleic acid-binding Zn-ribbon protein